MCRNITILRGLEPAATSAEIEAGARQYVRKISGIREPSAATEEAFEAAVAIIAAATTELLKDLPPRKQPPTTVPPLRRLGKSGAGLGSSKQSGRSRQPRPESKP